MSLALVIPAAALFAGLCDQPRLRPLRHSAETHLIVTATAETREAGEGIAPFTFAEWQPPGKRPTIAGQVVVLDSVRGAFDELVREDAGTSRRIVLVPWDHDPGCQPIPWSASPRWIPVGQRGFVAARLRPRARWVDRLPTFDVSDAWREPYSIERMKVLTTNMPEAAGAIMTPEEYASLYAALPEQTAWAIDPLAAVRPLREWRDRNPHLAAKYPARWTMQTTLRWAESQR